MSNKGKLGNLVQAEKSIGEKPDPDEDNDNNDNEEETAPDDKDSQEEKDNMRSEGGNN
jgi:hypothetical protein